MDTLLALPSQDMLQQSLQLAPGWAERLEQYLAQEFEALKQRDLATFETLQEPKGEVLNRLSELAQWCSQLQPAPPVWQALRDQLLQSREAHLRNIQLLQRQLEAVRGALQALQGESSAPAVDIYDRTGQVSRRYAAWSHHLA